MPVALRSMQVTNGFTPFSLQYMNVMKMTKLLQTMFARIATSIANCINCKSDNTFTSKTAEGVEMTFKVLNNMQKTCQVGTGAFSGTAISADTSGSITIPSSVDGYTVVSIGDNAFQDCSKMKSVTIPNSVTSIGDFVFVGCNSIESIISQIAEPFPVSDEAFQNNLCETLDAILYVPFGTKERYMATKGWGMMIEEEEVSF